MAATIRTRSSPDPIRNYIPFGAFGSMDPGINSPRVQQWNATVEQQLGRSWGVSASYLGSYSDRLWAQTALNPGIFMGLGPCTIQGVVVLRSARPTANLNQRRALYQINPVEAAKIGALDLNSDVGLQSTGHEADGAAPQRSRQHQRQLHAVEVLRARRRQRPSTRRAAATRSRTTRRSTPAPCDQDRTHLATLTTGYGDTGSRQRRGSRACVDTGGVTGILNARSGKPGSTSPAASTRRSRASTSSARTRSATTSTQARRRTLNDVLQPSGVRAAGAGVLGNLTRNAAGRADILEYRPGRVTRDSAWATRRVELRLESFNVLNHFNWGDPATNFNSGHVRPHHDAGRRPAGSCSSGLSTTSRGFRN